MLFCKEKRHASTHDATSPRNRAGRRCRHVCAGGARRRRGLQRLDRGSRIRRLVRQRAVLRSSSLPAVLQTRVCSASGRVRAAAGLLHAAGRIPGSASRIPRAVCRAAPGRRLLRLLIPTPLRG